MVYELYNDLHHLKTKNFKTMRSLLYIIAVILIIGWAIGTFAYAAGGLIHILLVIALISLILGFLRRDTVV
jgi:hypothetical protein